MDVQPRRIDVAEQLMARDALAMADGGDDVPVAELAPAGINGDGSVVLEVHDAGLDRVHRRPVRRRMSIPK